MVNLDSDPVELMLFLVFHQVFVVEEQEEQMAELVVVQVVVSEAVMTMG